MAKSVPITVNLPSGYHKILEYHARRTGVENCVILTAALRLAFNLTIPEWRRPRGPVQAYRKAKALRENGKTLAQVGKALNKGGYVTARGKGLWGFRDVSYLLKTQPSTPAEFQRAGKTLGVRRQPNRSGAPSLIWRKDKVPEAPPGMGD